ncbi:PREDICTED: protein OVEREXPRESSOR OF CATIONIC PEROXIDASE 3 [Tarenaya hassleriana]|uniref:protein OVEREXPRESSOR OF CATIONIC PEROXIDASE 3 n=1 Tax=Tarenaya hassleriana TaxID=28532 RepID=UPI00053C6198|nr:PREDICTED: protein OVEREXPRESSOR OF CATIONIC PEROXIDASE 3 [Tarenaya hassleriana]
MASALSSGFTSNLSSLCSSSASSNSRFLFWNPNPLGFALPLCRSSRSVLVLARRQNRNASVKSSSPSLKRKKKKGFGRDDGRREEGEEGDDDPFEALFNMLEEDLKNDDDGDDGEEISEEDLDAFAQELADLLDVGDDDGSITLSGSAAGDAHDGEEVVGEGHDDDDDDSEEDERPLKLKNWQLRRLAYALKAGRRKTSIKNLAAELCLDRAYVLELLRDPPPNLLMLSATLPDETPPPVAVVPESNSPDPLPVESTEDVIEPEEKVKEPVHVMQRKWSAQKRLKKVHVETMEKVYRRSKRPTNAMISSIVQVTNLPRKRVVKWFEDKRAEDGIPEKQAPYRAPV